MAYYEYSYKYLLVNIYTSSLGVEFLSHRIGVYLAFVDTAEQFPKNNCTIPFEY